MSTLKMATETLEIFELCFARLVQIEQTLVVFLNLLTKQTQT